MESTAVPVFDVQAAFQQMSQLLGVLQQQIAQLQQPQAQTQPEFESTVRPVRKVFPSAIRQVPIDKFDGDPKTLNNRLFSICTASPGATDEQRMNVAEA